MTPEEKALLEDTAKKLEVLIGIFSQMNYPDKFIIKKELVIKDRITFDNLSGVKIATTPSQKFAFWGQTPVVQQSAVTPPSGGVTVDSQARSAINSIITVLQSIGITA